ncbi:RNA polymerase sigma factor [Reichenbachiella agarivorans]|uniref:RNA polymerase sigma factor n=1 Tax=Reichenbachiella agarivorans TaxID=2979464 RepID=A0ABY6CLQ6_9BACT|nr:RNA polymerase sigma factor [Reichenbachiella agarivorans]UXP31446.1 RNA polymerase sigma factor [Reichenbachiella agarivorans]
MSLPNIALDHTEKLIERAKLGDKKSFNEVVGLWYKKIYNFCYKYCHDHDQASEAAQRTFIKVYDHLLKLEDIGKFKSWLYIIALNVCREESRRMTRVAKMFVSDGDDSKHVEVDGGETFAQVYDRSELSSIVIASLNQLGEEQKEVILMKEYEGLKFREIAEVLNISENTVKSRLYYGLSNLKKILVKNRAFKESYDYGK